MEENPVQGQLQGDLRRQRAVPGLRQADLFESRPEPENTPEEKAYIGARAILDSLGVRPKGWTKAEFDAEDGMATCAKCGERYWRTVMRRPFFVGSLCPSCDRAAGEEHREREKRLLARLRAKWHPVEAPEETVAAVADILAGTGPTKS